MATSTLNPNAPLFVPSTYLATEDFSPEWWKLVHTCPAFRDYWISERSHLLDEQSQDVDDFDVADDFVDQDFELLNDEEACLETNDGGDVKPAVPAKEAAKEIKLLSLDVLSPKQAVIAPLRSPSRLEKIPQVPAKALKKVSMHHIHQPR